jgi:hypothetical protein
LLKVAGGELHADREDEESEVETVFFDPLQQHHPTL